MNSQEASFLFRAHAVNLSKRENHESSLKAKRISTKTPIILSHCNSQARNHDQHQNKQQQQLS